MGEIKNQITAQEAKDIVEGKNPKYYSKYLNDIFDNIRSCCYIGLNSCTYISLYYEIPIGVINYLKSLGYDVNFDNNSKTKIIISW